MSPGPVLIVGATRGLGVELVSNYAAQEVKVLATARGSAPESGSNVTYIPGIDLLSFDAGSKLVEALEPHGPVSTVIISAGVFVKESFDEPDWDAEVKMYTTSAIAPVFLVQALVKAGLLGKGGRVVMVSSEAGSIGLRHEQEGGGNYAHHASKSALNMVTRLLSLDLKEKGITVVAIHPGFMRTEMTKNVGFDKFWDDGGAVTPGVAAHSLVEWIKTLDIDKTGQYWAPRGPRDIGTAVPVLGKNLPTPLQLPW